MQFDLTEIIVALIGLMGALTTGVLVPYIRQRTTVEQQQKINMWVKVAVNAAEQLHAGSGRGEEKKSYVLEFLRDKGFDLDEGSIDVLIENAVLELKKGVV